MLSFILFSLLISAVNNAHGQVVVSEIMGDPGFLADSEGEYLELVNMGEKVAGPDSALVVVNKNDTLILAALTLNPRQIYLACRDSAAMALTGSQCHIEWTGLRISNNIGTEAALYWAGNWQLFKTDAPRTGHSWENTLDAAKTYVFFTVAEDNWLGGDFGSPGYFHSGAGVVFNRDLTLQAQRDSVEKAIQFTLLNSGSHPFSKPSLRIYLDKDWDGLPDGLQDSTVFNFELAAGAAHSFTWKVPPEDEGVFICKTGEDENLRNNLASVLVAQSNSLVLTEICADPAEETPEWLEIQNVSGQQLNLRSVSVHDMALSTAGAAYSPVLRPGGYLVIVADEKAFTEVYGKLKLSVIEPASWHVLRNTGDTVRIQAFGVTLDSMHYTSLKKADKGNCLVRDKYHPGVWQTAEGGRFVLSGNGAASSPGYETLQDSIFSWSVSDKILDISNPLAYLVFKIKAPVSRRYSLRIYDLSGHEVRRLCTDCNGTRKLKWYGNDDSGNTLPIGPYVIWVRAGGARPEKRAVVLAKPL